MKIVILTTDTLHHRYLIKRLENNGHIINNYIFENNSIKPSFKTGPFFDKIQRQFEEISFFKDFGKKINNNKIINVENINDNISIRSLKKIKPDIGIVFGTRKISDKVIKLFKMNLINIHRGMIEKYRGIDSELWAIYHNDYNNIGVTIHKVESILDAGRIYFKKKIIINKEIKIYQLRYFTTIIAADLINKFLNNYSIIKNKSKKQKVLGRYYSHMPLSIKKTLSKKLKNYIFKNHE